MIILLGNITKTLKAKSVLEREGIDSVPIQTTKNPSKPDCGHGLKIDSSYYDMAKKILTGADIKIKGVYND